MVSLVRGIVLMTKAPRSGEGGLCRRDKTLGAPAFRAFIDVMHKTRLFLLDARKPHPPTAFEANGLLAERLRSGLRFHELLSAKASQGSMTGWFTPILSGPAAASRAGESPALAPICRHMTAHESRTHQRPS